jgi:hypothetical protein
VLERHTRELYLIFDQINRTYRQIESGLARFEDKRER